MRRILQLDVAEVSPTNADVFRRQGVGGEDGVPERLRRLVATAGELFQQLAEPRGVFERLTDLEFESIYRGEGGNDPEAALGGIYPKALGLALFAATLGEPVSRRVKELFRDDDLALGYMLDAVASEAADRLATRLAFRFVELLTADGKATQDLRALPYSPGYCGWNITGQGKLFERLRPRDVGMELNGSFLMEPLKSVSGLIVAGPGKIHKFRASFSYCKACQTHDCRERMASVLRAASPTGQHRGRQGKWSS